MDRLICFNDLVSGEKRSKFRHFSIQIATYGNNQKTIIDFRCRIQQKYF